MTAPAARTALRALAVQVAALVAAGELGAAEAARRFPGYQALVAS